MSRSRKLPIIKDKPRNFKASTYYRRVRRKIKQEIKNFNLEIPWGLCEEEYLDIVCALPDAKSIVNSYNYCDYKFDLRKSKNKKLKTKASRK